MVAGNGARWLPLLPTSISFLIEKYINECRVRVGDDVFVFLFSRIGTRMGNYTLGELRLRFNGEIFLIIGWIIVGKVVDEFIVEIIQENSENHWGN